MQKKTKQVASNVPSYSVCKVQNSKNNQKAYGSTSGLSPSVSALNSLIAESSGCVEQPAISNSELAYLFDSMTQRLEASSCTLSSSVLSADHHSVPGGILL